MSRAAQRAQAAGPERFRSPARSTRPPVWKSLLAALLLILVIIGLPVLLLATVGLPPIPTELGLDTLTQAISVDALLGVLTWVIWLAWMQFTFCTLVETVSAIRGRSVPGHVPFSGGVQAVARRLVASVLLLGAVSGPLAAAAAPVVEEPTPAVAAAQDSARAATRTTDASGASITSGTVAQNPDGSQQMRYMVGGVEIDPALGSQLVGQRVYVVQPPEGRYHDNLWDIAERNLGDGRAYTRIYDLNAGRVQPDGGFLELARLIQPGWLMVMPEEAASVPRVEAVPVAPAPATPAPATPNPEEARSGGVSIDQGLASTLRDVPPVQMPAVGALLAASLVSVLVRRRRQLSGGAFDEGSGELERLLRVGADERRAQRLNAILRSLDSIPGSPRPYAVAIDDDACYLRLAQAVPEAPAPWRVQEEGLTWVMRAGREPAPTPNGSLLPGLVTVGRIASGADILIDLAFADGEVAVTGDPAMAAEVVTAFALELCTNSWSQDAVVVGAGLPTALREVAGGRIQSPEALLASDPLPGRADVITGRRPGAATTFVLVGNGEATPSLPPGGDYAVVRAGGDGRARWTIDVDASGTARIDQLGIAVRATRATENEVLGLAHLFGPTQVTDDGTRPPIPDPPTPPMMTAALRTADVRIQVLGQTLVEAAGAVEPERRSILTEAAICVALHPEGIRPAVLGTMLWPLGATADVVAGTVERLRAWLGHDAQGLPHLREDAEGRLVMGPGVVVDWDVLRSLLASSRGCPPQREVELLIEALRLVRGPMVAGAEEGRYTWMARVRAAHQYNALVVDAAHRVVELTGDTDPDGAGMAIATGLAVVDLDQGLWRDRLRLAARRGRGELEREVHGLLSAAGADDLAQVDPATAALVEDLAPGLSVARRPA